MRGQLGPGGVETESRKAAVWMRLCRRSASTPLADDESSAAAALTVRERSGFACWRLSDSWRSEGAAKALPLQFFGGAFLTCDTIFTWGEVRWRGGVAVFVNSLMEQTLPLVSLTARASGIAALSAAEIQNGESGIMDGIRAAEDHRPSLLVALQRESADWRQCVTVS